MSRIWIGWTRRCVQARPASALSPFLLCVLCVRPSCPSPLIREGQDGSVGLDYSSTPHPIPPHVGGGKRCVSSWPRFRPLRPLSSAHPVLPFHAGRTGWVGLAGL